MSPKPTRAQVAPEISHPLFYPMVVLGFYPTAKAALKGFGIPEKMAKELIRQSGPRGENSIIVSSPRNPEIVFGAVQFEGQWMAAHGRTFSAYETLSEAKGHVDELIGWAHANGQVPPLNWVFLRHTKPATVSLSIH